MFCTVFVFVVTWGLCYWIRVEIRSRTWPRPHGW